MTLTDLLFGRPLATSDERAEQVGVAAGIPIFGLDALSSAAYCPEAARKKWSFAFNCQDGAIGSPTDSRPVRRQRDAKSNKTGRT